MKILYTAFALLFSWISIIVNAQAPNWEWAKSARGINNSSGAAVTTDACGHVYVAGNFAGRIFFGNYTDSTGGSVFLVKYDSTGNVLWAESADGLSNSVVFSMNNANGYIVVTGDFYGPNITFGDDTLFNPDSSTYSAGTIFVVKYDSTGKVIWARSSTRGAPAPPVDQLANQSIGASIDPFGNIYITGFYQTDTLVFGDYTLTQQWGSQNLFLIKYDSAGDIIWAKTTPGWCASLGICTDVNGNIYVTGFTGENNFPFFDSIPPGTFDDFMFIAKYGTDGNVVWANDINDGPYVTGVGISADSKCNVYVTGNNDISSFVAKYDSSGKNLWTQWDGSPDCGQLGSSSIYVDFNENIYVTGFALAGDCNYSTDSLISFGDITAYVGACSVFVVEYDSIGDAIWVNVAGNAAFDGGTGICADRKGNIYVTGAFYDSVIYFDDYLLTDVYADIGYPAFFVAKLGDNIISKVLSVNPASPITIFPNPTTGSIYFRGVQAGYKLQVYNLLGEEVYSATVTQENYSISLAGKAKGMYFYRVADEDNLIQQGKIVVQ